MVKYRCGICNREFSTAGGLRQHGNAKYNGRTSFSRRSYTQPRSVQRSEHIIRLGTVPTKPEHEGLWNTPIVMSQTQPQLQTQSQTSASSLLTLPTLEETPVDDYDGNGYEMEDVISRSRRLSGHRRKE